MIQMKKTGLALGGGAVLGAAHVGVLKALDEASIKVDYIAGTSIGAFVAAFYAFGKSWKEIQGIAAELRWIDISAISLSQFGLLSNDKLGALIEDHIGNKNIEDAKIPLAIIATDASSGEKIVLTEGSVSKAVQASTCIPGIFKPVEYKKSLLVDGGIVENVPVHSVKELGAEFTIGVDLNAKHAYQKPDNILDVIINSFHFILKTAATYQTEAADLLISPDLSDFNRSDMDQVDELMKKGYQDAKKALDSYLND